MIDFDFTGNTPSFPLKNTPKYLGSTGNGQLDQTILQLCESIPSVDNENALAEMMITAVKLARGGATPGDFKMINRALKEMRYANEIFDKYNHRRKVAVFGSARTPSDDPEYKTAIEFSRRMNEDHGYMTITGAGPGIMAAGNEGAGKKESFGLNISLPFEASANEFINGDEKLIEFNYFFTRKLSFVKEAHAAVACPGGVGTMDEIFEAMTLIQTGKATIYPLVLLNAPGSDYWQKWDEFLRSSLLDNGYISETDFHLWKVTDSIDEAIKEITTFYKNFHSYRYVGETLIIRISHPLTNEAVKELNKDFADLIKEGQMKISEPLEGEAEYLNLPRLIFKHKRRDYGRLRALIDAINTYDCN